MNILFHRIFRLQEALTLRVASISTISLSFNFLSILFSQLTNFWKFVIDILPESDPEPEPTSDLSSNAKWFYITFFLYLLIKLLAGNPG